MSYTRVVFVFSLAVGVVISMAAMGEEGCASCGPSSFADAATFLASMGYSADEYTVLLSWQETVQGGPSFVTGYHVLQTGAGQAFDLYADTAGNLLGTKDLNGLGIAPKNWDLRPVEQQTETPNVVAQKSVAARPAPRGTPPPVTLELGPLDFSDIRNEDGRNAGKGPRRVGVVRDLPRLAVIQAETATVGSWETRPDGSRLWAVTLSSPQARAIRLHFTELSVPEGCRLILYNAANPVEAYGPYEHFHGHDTDLWSASCFSDTVTLECYVAPGADVRGLRVSADSVAHTYADFGQLPWAKAAACYPDVSCSPEWATVASGVGAFVFVQTPNELHCTGALVADSDPATNVPYFLTANHCVNLENGSQGASSVEFYWLFQTSSCDGAAPALASVPRTSGGADLLAGISAATGSDFTLLRLRETPPSGLSFLGWSTNTVGVGAQVAAIHHPGGDHKRISFGSLTNTGSPENLNQPIKPYTLFHEVLYSNGSTEQGSSGCPLFLKDKKLIIGQLWGGYASCDAVDEPDYYGRFDMSFPVLESWLSPNPVPTDVNRSGKVDSVDLQLVVNAALGKQIAYNADVDRSGTVDAVDVQLEVLAVLNSATQAR